MDEWLNGWINEKRSASLLFQVIYEKVKDDGLTSLPNYAIVWNETVIWAQPPRWVLPAILVVPTNYANEVLGKMGVLFA